MGVFIDDILSGNVQEILGDLYVDTVSHIVVWWAVLPLVGIILTFALIIVQLFGGHKS